MIYKRLKKNYNKIISYFKSGPKVEAFRLYDRDIPEYPYIVDIFGEIAVIYEKGKAGVHHELRDRHQLEIISGVKELLNISEEKIFLKERFIQDNFNSQYQKLDVLPPSPEETSVSVKSINNTNNTNKANKTNKNFLITEGAAKFLINPYEYLDCGLFLDHRNLRFKLFKEAKSDNKVLNLFSYTGSLSVVCALKNAITVSVDWSKTYQKWAQENFLANNISLDKHKFIDKDIVSFLEEANLKIRNNPLAAEENKFDIIIIDPPTFSNSKKRKTAFGNNWEVERDHAELIALTLPLLRTDGIIYFSTNKRDFRLSPILADKKNLQIRNTSKESIPFDFRDKRIHHSFSIRVISIPPRDLPLSSYQEKKEKNNT